MDLFSDKRFLSTIHGYERQSASADFCRLGSAVEPDCLPMTAVARKVIALPAGTESKSQLLAGFYVIVAGLAAAY